MRDLSEQEIKDLYQTEYDSQAPDVWADIERKLKQQAAEAERKSGVQAAETERKSGVQTAETEPKSGMQTAEVPAHDKLRNAAGLPDKKPDVLEFPKVGKKRWFSVIGSVAACFVIIGAYMWQNGSLPFMDGDKAAEPMTESAFNDTCNTEASAPPESDQKITLVPAEESADLSDDNAGAGGVDVNEMETDAQGWSAADKVLICVDGRMYTYVSQCAPRALDLKGLEYIGTAIPVEKEETPKEHLQVSSADISGEVYFDGEKTVYVVDEVENTAYIFTEE